MKKLITLSILLGLWSTNFAQLSPDALMSTPVYRDFPLDNRDSVYRVTIENPGSLPYDIDTYPNLQSIYLFGNDWDYSFNSLPETFFTLQKLQNFEVHNTDLDDLTNRFVELKNIESLDFCSNTNFSLPANLGQLPKLKSLAVSNLDSLPHMPTLETLSLTLWGDTMKLPKGISDNQNLKQLEIYSTSGFYDAREIARLIGSLPNLEVFIFDNPYTSEYDSIQKVLEAIHQAPKLRKLSLRFVILYESTVSYFENLTELELKNIICVDQDLMLNSYDALGNLYQLQKMRINYNRYDAAEYEKLKHLYLNLENWADDASVIQADLLRLASIEGLEGLAIQKIAPGLSQLTRIAELDLSRASNLGSPDRLFTDLANLKKLKKLRLHSDSLKEFPEEAGALSSLEELEYFNFSHGVYEAIDETQKLKIKRLLPNCKIRFIE